MTETIHIEPSNATITVIGEMGDATVYNTVEKQLGTLVWVNKIGKLITSECLLVTTVTQSVPYAEIDEKYLVHGSEVPHKRIIKFIEND